MVYQTQLFIKFQIRQLCIDSVDLKIVAEDLRVADLVQAFHHLLPIVKQAVDVEHRISTSLEVLVRRRGQLQYVTVEGALDPFAESFGVHHLISEVAGVLLVCEVKISCHCSLEDAGADFLKCLFVDRDRLCAFDLR